MKRQRRTVGGSAGGGGGGGGAMEDPRFEGTTATKMKLGSKKAKKIIDHEVGKEEAMIPGGRDDHQMGLVAAEKAVVVGEEMVNYWGCLSGDVVDEQMSWGSIWLPFWDVEFMEESHYGLFCDVIWDDDIWGLRSIKEMPNP